MLDTTSPRLPAASLTAPGTLSPGAGSPQAGSRPVADHLPVLDGLRGIAILSVMVFHVTTFVPVGAAEKAVRLATQFGWAGVDLFFVLSGFLLTRILVSTRTADNYYRAFYMRRVLRIFPLYYLYCAVLFVLLPVVVGVHDPRAGALYSAAPWYLTYLLNVRIAFQGAWTPAAITGTAMFWSLCVEEQFYFVWPWTVRRLSERTLARLCLALVVVALGWRWLMTREANLFAAYVLLPSRMDALGVGALVALWLRQADGSRMLARWAPLVLGGCALGLAVVVGASGYAGWDTVAMTTLGMTMTALGSAALLALVVTARPQAVLSRLMAAGWLRKCGKHAYALYLLSWVGDTLVEMTPLPHVVPERLLGSAFPLFAYRLLLFFTAQFLLALAAWHLVEKRALRLKRFFDYRLSPARRRTADGV